MNDKKIVKELEKAVNYSKEWLKYVKELGNQCAYTDRWLEQIFDAFDNIKQLYKSNFIK